MPTLTDRRALGRTGLMVSPLGLGAGPLGDLSFDEGAAVRLVHEALEHGINVLDTAPSYGASEARLGLALRDRRARRQDVVLVTKGGYGVPGVGDWTPEVMTRGIDQALARLGTDYLDVFLLHSCDRARLGLGDLFEPLVRARSAGKIRAVGYSGDGEPLDYAIACGVFDVVECSVNVVDQQALSTSIPRAITRGVGVLAKRSLANAAFRADAALERDDVRTYRRRFEAMFDGDLSKVTQSDALRFTVFTEGVTCALLGTRSSSHLSHAVADVGAGPLSAHDAAEIRARFARHGDGWPGLV